MRLPLTRTEHKSRSSFRVGEADEFSIEHIALKVPQAHTDREIQCVAKYSRLESIDSGIMYI